MTPESLEIIPIVDTQDNILYYTTRDQMRLQKLCTRYTYIFPYKQKTKQFLIQKRSMNKKYCPGYYDLTFGGIVQANQSYDENAVQEILEEIGIQSKIGENLNMIFKFLYLEDMWQMWGQAYMLYLNDEQIYKQDDEVEAIYYKTYEEIQQLIQNEKIAPDGLHAFQILLKEHYKYL